MSKRQYFTIRFFFFSFLSLAFSQNGVAQIIKGKENKHKAAEHIVALKEGTLVMLLPSKHKNLLAIEKALNEEGLSNKSKKRLNKKKAKILKKRAKGNKATVDALWEYYEFSEFRVIHDTAMVHIAAGKTSGFFLGDDLKIDTSISIDHNAAIYSVRFGKGSVSETNNFEGFIIRDSENEQPPRPFPYFVKAMYPASSFLDAFIGKGADTSPNFPKMIYRLNIQLTNYYPNAQYRLNKQKLKDDMEKLQEGIE